MLRFRRNSGSNFPGSLLPGEIAVNGDGSIFLGCSDRVESHNESQVEILPQASISWSLDNGQNFQTIADRDIAFQPPTGGKSGKRYELLIAQDSAGGHAISLPSSFKFPQGVSFSPSTGSDGITLVRFRKSGNNFICDPPATVTLTLTFEQALPDSNLRSALDSRYGITDFAGLEAQTGAMDLSGASISDVTGIDHATGIYELNIANNSVADLSPLSTMGNLTNILMAGNSGIVSLDPLINLSGANYIDAKNTGVTNLDGLANMSSLDVFNGSWSNISDISALNSSSLWALYLNGTPLASLSGVENCPALFRLHCDQTQVSDLSPLTNLTGLERLFLYATNVSDISPLSGLVNLWQLHVDSTAISDISDVSGMSGMRRLRFGGTSVSNLSPLSGLTALEILAFNSASVSDISPLLTNGLSSIQEIYAHNNGLSQVQVSNLLDLLWQRRGIVSFIRIDANSAPDLDAIAKIEGTGSYSGDGLVDHGCTVIYDSP